jgi:hypothetical protein
VRSGETVGGLRYHVAMARQAAEFPADPAVVVTNPHDEVTADTFRAWLDHRQSGEPTRPGVRAAETLSDLRAIGEA